jgi:phosphoribosyl 1,2-cyclic phosphodiesterase
MTLRFLSLASGSEGNCYYLGTPEYGVLLDAGISCRSIKRILKTNGIEIEQILAVFITHDHSDHIRSVGQLGGRLSIPLYATSAVHEKIKHSRLFDKTPAPIRRTVQKGEPIVLRDLTVTAFEVPHDAADCIGYRIQYKNNFFVLATDVGHITPTVAENILLANHLILEANYDHDMLFHGPYPYLLKRRISNGAGHLCNTEAADFLAAHYHPRLRSVWLCHLSHNNNLPELALDAVKTAFDRQGIALNGATKITALRRKEPSELYVLD